MIILPATLAQAMALSWQVNAINAAGLLWSARKSPGSFSFVASVKNLLIFTDIE